MSAVIATPQKIDLRRLPVLAKQQIDKAELPQRYKAAVAALRECDRIDELKDIEDKHSAIAHYAKQIKDNALMYYAERIRLRAFERIGELLSELPGYEERKQAAKANGIDIPTANRAVLAVQMPKKVRDILIDRDPPPSRKTLAEYGREYQKTTASFQTEGLRRYLRREEEVKHTPGGQALEILSYLDSWRQELEMFMSDGCGGKFTMKQIGRAVHPDDAPDFRKRIAAVVDLLDELEQALPKSN